MSGSTPEGAAEHLLLRCLLVGLFEGIDSERGIAWRVADSMSLRSFLGLPLGKKKAEQIIERVKEAVPDRDYHSNEVLVALKESETRAYIAEPERGRRNWKNKEAERDAVHRNRRRMRRGRSPRGGRSEQRSTALAWAR